MLLSRSNPIRLRSGTHLVFLSLLFLAALAIRLGVTAAFVGVGAPPDAGANPDQLDYEEIAFQLSQGNGFVLASGEPTARRPPGTSFTLLPVYWLFGRSYFAARVWFCLLSASTCLLVAWTASKCFGSAAGFAAGLLLAFYPGHFYYTMHLLSEPPYGFFLSLGCALTIASLGRRPGVADALAGASYAAAVLTRPQVLLIIPIGLLMILILRPLRTKSCMQRFLLQSSVLLVCLSPWAARNLMVLGKPTLSTIGGIGFWGAHNEVVASDPQLQGMWMRVSDLESESYPVGGSEVEREEIMWHYGFEFLKRNPQVVPRLLAMKVFRFLTPFETTPNRAVYWTFASAWMLTLPLVLVGLWLAYRESVCCTMVLLAPILATLGTVLVFYGSIRFRDSVSPLLVIPAGITLSRVFSRLRPRLSSDREPP